MSPKLSFRLVPGSTAPSVARAHVREFLGANGLGGGGRVDELPFASALLTSELVTHAVELGDHAAGELLLELDLTGETLHTELSIDDAALPIDLPATGDHQVASGLLVIASLARCWGASRTDGGTRLWFDLDAASSR